MSNIIPTFLLLPILTTISYIDIRERRIPNRITFPSLLGFVTLLFVMAIFWEMDPYFSRAMVGAIFAFLFFFSLHAMYPSGIGMGDVKLSALVGLLLGWKSFDALMYGIAATFISSSIYSIFLVMKSRESLKSSIPFAPFMTLGYVFGIAFF